MKVRSFDWPVRKGPKSEPWVWVGIIIFIILVFALFYFFFLTPSLDHIDKYHERIETHQKAINNLAANTETVMESSVLSDSAKLNYLGNKVIFLEEQYANFLNDIRQETNNHIEYNNTWLGIWIAILALVCGVVPALLQYRLYIINRQKLKEELELYEQIIGCHDINNYVNSVGQCMDSQIISDSPNSRKLIGILLNKTTDSFYRLLELLHDEHKDFITTSHRNVLVLSLVQLSGMLDRIKIRVNSNNLRELNRLTTEIQKTIIILTDTDTKETDDKTYKHLFSILQTLRNLRVEWDFIDK